MSAEEVAAEEAVEKVVSPEESQEIQEEVAESEELSDEESAEGAELSAEQEEELADAVGDAIEDGASEEEVRELIETFKLKVNGKEKEVTLDWNNKDDIIRRLQLAEASQEAMKKSAELEKVFDREISRLTDNPWEVLEELGLNPDELAEQRIQRAIEEMQKSPEQIEQEKKDTELQKLRDELKKREEEQERLEMERLEREAESELKDSINKALSATTKLPKSEYVQTRVANTMLSFMDNGYEDITAEDVVPIVEKEIREEQQLLLDSLSDDDLIQFLGKKTVDRLRKQRLKKMPKTAATKETGKVTAKADEPTKKQSIKDFLKNGIR